MTKEEEREKFHNALHQKWGKRKLSEIAEVLGIPFSEAKAISLELEQKGEVHQLLDGNIKWSQKIRL